MPRRERVFEPVLPPPPVAAVPAPLPPRPPLPPRAPVATPDTVEPPAATLPPVHVARPRVAPQRILPSANADTGGRRGIGRMMGGRKRKVTVVDELDELDFG